MTTDNRYAVEVPGLAFDEERHEYRWQGKIVPSVTGVLSAAGLVETTWFNDAARLRGQHVHRAAHLYDEEDLALDSVRPEILPYLQGYLAFREETGFYPVLIEQRVYSAYGFAGTLDRVGWLNDRLVQIDLKTGGIPPTVGLQTAAYELALEEVVRGGAIKLERFPEARFALQLTADGKYKLWPLNGQRDRDFFLGALAVSQFKAGNP